MFSTDFASLHFHKPRLQGRAVGGDSDVKAIRLHAKVVFIF